MHVRSGEGEEGCPGRRRQSLPMILKFLMNNPGFTHLCLSDPPLLSLSTVQLYLS